MIDTLGSSLFGKTRKAILGLFFTNTESSYYLREVVQNIDSGMGAVQRELANLTHSGILNRRKEGRQVYFQVNKSCPIFTELLSIIKKTFGLAGLIKQSLVPLTKEIQVAFIFGSFVTFQQTLESDVDLLLIGNVSFSDVIEALEAAQQSLGREINPTTYTKEEFREKLKQGHHFLTSIMREEKLFVIGDRRELSAMVK